MHTADNELDGLAETRTDYERWLVEYGFSHALVRAVVENMADHIDMPTWVDAVELRPSPIHGKGMFATRVISSGELVAPARIEKRRTHAGRYTNHSITPNARFVLIGDAPDGDVNMVATRQIHAGEEVLMDYRQAGSANGSGMYPSRAKSIETVKLRLGVSAGTKIAETDLDQFFAGVLLALHYLPSDLVMLIRARTIENMAAQVGYLRAGILLGNARSSV